MVSLQSFDRDPNTGNYHVLMDRIGIFVCHGERSFRESYRLMEALDMDLPMDDEKITKLVAILERKLSEKSADPTAGGTAGRRAVNRPM